MTGREGSDVLRGSAVQVRGLVKEYRSGRIAVPALRGIDLDVAPGAFAAVMGQSGCGKSTLLYVVGGMLRATSGSVRVGGLEVTRAQERALTAFRRVDVGFVFQRLNLIAALSVEDNLKLACRIAGRTDRSDERIRALLERVGLEGKRRSRPLDLSQGEQQRVAIARALVKEPRLVLADEPTGNLDSANARMVMSLFRQIGTGAGPTILMITHDAECAAVADTVIQMRDGAAVSSGALRPRSASPLLAPEERGA
jgi:putative ABC transport system ATP-binding protein